MSFFSNRVKEPARTQIVAKGFVIDEIVREDILDELRKKFSEHGDLVATLIQFRVIPKHKAHGKLEVKKDEKKEVLIEIKPADFIELSHPSESHLRNNIVVITSNKNAILERFLE